MLQIQIGKIKGLLAIVISLTTLLPTVTGCGEDERLREYAGTYVLERTIGEERTVRTLELKPDGDYSFQEKSITHDEIVEAEGGEWFVRRDRITGGDAIGLYPNPTNIRNLEITEGGDLRETASDSIYSKLK